MTQSWSVWEANTPPIMRSTSQNPSAYSTLNITEYKLTKRMDNFPSTTLQKIQWAATTKRLTTGDMRARTASWSCATVRPAAEHCPKACNHQPLVGWIGCGNGGRGE